MPVRDLTPNARPERAATRQTAPEPAEPAALPSWGDIPWRQGVAIALWLVAVACTQQATGHYIHDGLLSWGAALLAQAVCTLAESPFWRRRAWDPESSEEYTRPLGMVNILFLLIDAALNMAGVWMVVKQLHELAFVQALAEMLGGQAQPLTGLPAVGLCAVISLGLCAGPERIWFSEG